MEENILTVEDLKKEISEQDYDTCTLGDESVAERCLEKARVWTTGKILSTGNLYDENQTVTRMIVLKRATYELFAFVSLESRARAKESDAIDLLESYFGQVSGKKNEAEGPAGGPSLGTVMPGKKVRYGD